MRRSALGYMRIACNAPPGEENRLHLLMNRFAEERGLVLGDVFIEEDDSPSSEFAALIEAIQSSGATAVVIPSILHLGHLESVRMATKQLIEEETGASVLTLPESR